MASLFDKIVEGPIDPILGTEVAFKADSFEKKVNLGVGAYRTEEGKPYVFEVVQKVQRDLVAANVDKEYLPIDGLASIKPLTQRLVFGDDCPAVQEGRITSMQALSGTGGLRVAAEFVKAQMPETKSVYISNPSWTNHKNIFGAAGLPTVDYAFWDSSTRSLDIEGMLRDLNNAPPQSLIVLHACAHNPTGVDPTSDQWSRILEVVAKRKLIPLFDVAYQGYASGNMEKDAEAIRMFQSSGLEMFVTQSFSKNLGLYNERIGMLHIVCNSAERAAVILTQLKPIARRMYSSPPAWGARIVNGVLGSPENFAHWKTELEGVAGRIKVVRKSLEDGLVAKGTPGSWSHITQQIGMFSYTGLSVPQCERMISKWHIYLLKSGRISLAGINTRNVQYLVDAIDDCVRSCPSSSL